MPKKIILPDGAEKYTSLHRTKGDYEETITQEFEAMAPFLPASVSSILDIGAGLGGIDVLLKDMYPDAMFHLMDGTGMAKHRTSYRAEMEAYNDLHLTVATMHLNGVNAIIYEIDPAAEIHADLVLSLYSWCFHYPSDVYRDLVDRSGASHVIVDVRTDKPEPFPWSSQLIATNKSSERRIYSRNGPL